MKNNLGNGKWEMGNQSPRVAIVHDWLYGGGAEKVVLELHKMFPDAPIYTSYCNDEWRGKLDGKVITGYLQRWPFSKLRKFLPLLRHWWFKGLDLSEFDLVISSSGNGEAKAMRVSPKATHISYSHSVNQFYWRYYDEYLRNPGQRPYWLMRLGLKLLVKPMRKKDYEAAQKVDFFIACSTFVQKEIKEHYNRDSVVIHPPVETTDYGLRTTDSKARQGFVTMSRLAPWKRVDIIVKACSQLSLPLTVIGDGPERANLEKMAGPTVKFLGPVFDESRFEQLADSEAFIMASLEPFGIAPIEAMAVGTPVIAYRAGGALDYVKPGQTGEFFDEQTAESLMETLESFDSKKYKLEQVQKAAQRFSPANFQQKLEGFLGQTNKESR